MHAYKYRSSSSIANPRFRARLHAGVLIDSFYFFQRQTALVLLRSLFAAAVQRVHKCAAIQ